MSRRLALLIGNIHYADGRLQSPVTAADLQALTAVLREQGQFDAVDVLIDKTAVDVQLAIAEFFDREKSPDDFLLLYFAGQILPYGEAVLLALHDTYTEAYLDATTVPLEFVQRRMGYCPAKQQVVIVDGLLNDGVETGANDSLLTQVATAGRAMLISTVPAGDGMPASSFTQMVTQGLQSGVADANKDGTISLAELTAYVASQHSYQVQQDAPTAGNEWVMGYVAGGATAVALPVPAKKPINWRVWAGIAAVVLIILLLIAFFAFRPALTPTDAVSVATATDAPTTTAVANATQDEATPTQPPSPTPLPSPTLAAGLVLTPTATILATPTAVTDPSPTIPPTETLTAVPPTATATNTPIPSATATPLPSPTTPIEPIGLQIVAEAAFLRAGPGINYRILSYPVQGTRVTAVAASGDRLWYNVYLADGSNGWVYYDTITPSADIDLDDLPVAATIPVPVNEFYDFGVTNLTDSLVATAYHVYVGDFGPEARFEARLLPETDLVQPNYLNDTQLGLGLLIAEFSRVGAGDYRSTGVELCMVSEATGQSFYCQTFPFTRNW